MNKMQDKARQAVAGFTSGQKAMMVVATVGVIVGLMFFTRTAGGDSMAPLFSNLDAADASAITGKLDTQGVSYELGSGGTSVLVPANQVYSLRLAMSASGLPAGGAASFALLDKQGITTSQFRQRVDYQRALGGELGRTIAAMDGIDGAVVNLVIPNDDVFADDSQKASASVLVRTSGESRLSAGHVKALVNLVAQAVPSLVPDAISVTDQKGTQLWFPGKSDENLAGGDTSIDRTASFQNQMATDLEQLIIPSVGVGKVHVAVTAQLDFDQQEQTQTLYNNPGTDGSQVILAADASTETYAGTGSSAINGILGVANPAADPTAAAPTTTAPVTPTPTGSGAYSNVKNTTQYAVNKIDTAIKTAPGKITRLGISVVVDDKAVDDAAAAKIKSLLTPYLDTERGDVLSIERMTFPDSAVTDSATSSALDASASGGGLMGILRMVFTALIVLVAMFLAWRSIRKAAKGDVASTIDLRELDKVRAEIRELTSGPGTSAIPSSLYSSERVLLPASDGSDPYSLDPIPMSRAAVMATQMEAEITDLIDRQPDEVAALLRNWLADRRSVRR
jgi:flagellar M-ring protein FliF